MKKKRIRLFAIVFACIFTFSGCGEPLYEMTDAERDIVVHAAAYLIAKHNIRQTDGISSYKPREEDLMDPEELEPDPLENVPANDYGFITYAEAIGQDKTEVTYNGMSIDVIYKEGGYYLLTPKQGKKYAILRYRLRNPYIDAITIDAYSTGPVFYANFGDGNYIKQESTFLTYSMPTYVATLGAGESQDVVMLFQIDEEFADSANLVSMIVELDGVKYNINL